MFIFIAGYISTGLLKAIMTVVNISSAIPWANLPMKLAVAGAIIAILAASARNICSTEGLSRSPHMSQYTGFPLKVASVMGVTNFEAERVITTCTFIPALTMRRTNDGILYADIPPVMPSRMDELIA
jgi:hypothetical protein